MTKVGIAFFKESVAGRTAGEEFNESPEVHGRMEIFFHMPYIR